MYIEHIERGVDLAAQNPEALLLFSGGRTRKESGEWSEAQTYYDIADDYGWWKLGSSEQVDIAEYAKDSFENLLFSICRFQMLTGRYPRNIDVVGWGFKKRRFELHAKALRWSEERLRYHGVNDPIDLDTASTNERNTAKEFSESLYGQTPELREKRNRRNPHGQEHRYWNTVGLAEFFRFMEDPSNAKVNFPCSFPWEDTYSTQSSDN